MNSTMTKLTFVRSKFIVTRNRSKSRRNWNEELSWRTIGSRFMLTSDRQLTITKNHYWCTLTKEILRHLSFIRHACPSKYRTIITLSQTYQTPISLWITNLTSSNLIRTIPHSQMDSTPGSTLCQLLLLQRVLCVSITLSRTNMSSLTTGRGSMDFSFSRLTLKHLLITTG